jgi:HEAT repeat protein
MVSIRWLHLTDLHMGMTGLKDYWPAVEEVFFEDLEYLREKVGMWDLVLFTGDLTQRGTPDEFEQINQLLERLNKKFNELEGALTFLSVPGNHDLVRPNNQEDPSLINLLYLWHNPAVHTPFWENPKSPQRRLINKIFANYMEWWRKTPARNLDSIREGKLPGDFSATFEKGGVKLGIVGLNTSFLHLADVEEGSLTIHVSQLNEACGEAPPDWIKKHDVCLLLTHHPMNWLSEKGQEELKAYIYPPGRFAAHLFGHMHRSNLSSLSEGAAAARRYMQGASLFGVEGWGKGGKEQRIHGYSLCELNVLDKYAELRIWPRLAVKNQSGGWSIERDQSFTLVKGDDCTAPIPIQLLRPRWRDKHNINTTGDKGGDLNDASEGVNVSSQGLTTATSLVVAYLEELANQRPYADWDNSTYIDRDVVKDEALFSRTVTLHKRAEPHETSESKSTEIEGQPSTMAEKSSAAPSNEPTSQSLMIWTEAEDQSSVSGTLPAAPLKEILQSEGRLMLLGEPGMGKTTSLLHLVWESASYSLSSLQVQDIDVTEIPIHVELKYYDGEPEFETFLARKVNDILGSRRLRLGADVEESTKALKFWMSRPEFRFLLLVDGLNEVQPRFHLPIRRMLQALLKSPHRIVIACRERDYDQSFQDFASAYVLQGLQKDEIRDYLERVLGEPGTRLFNEQIKREMLSLAANPLLLWLISKVAQHDPGVTLPTNRGTLFRQFISQMPRLRRSESVEASIPVDIVLSAMAKLGFEMQEREQVAIGLDAVRMWNVPTLGRDLEDILTQAKEWRFLKADGRMGEPIEFIHQLFMEYFAAVHLNNYLLKGQSLEEVLGERPYNVRWNEVILMLAGIADHPSELVKWLSAKAVARQEKSIALLIHDCFETTQAVSDVDARLALINAMITALGDMSDPDRSWAMKRYLISMGETAVAPLLLALHSNNDQFNYIEIGDQFRQKEIVSTLGHIGDPQAVEPIIKVLKSRAYSLHGVAAAALGLIGDMRAIPHLIECLNHPVSHVVIEAAGALRRMPNYQSTIPLASIMMKHQDPKVRRAAAIALESMADERVVEDLINALRDDWEVSWYAERALVKVGEPAAQALIPLLLDNEGALQNKVAHILEWMGVDAIPSLKLVLTLSSNRLSVRLRVMHIMRAIGHPTLVPVLIELLMDDSKEVRQQAEHTLVRIGEQAVEPLVNCLKNSDIKFRWRVISVLRRIGAPAVVPLIAAAKDPIELVRLGAAYTLKNITDTRAIGPLSTALRHEDPLIRQHAVYALGEMVDYRAVRPLIAALRDEAVEVRREAAHALGQVADQRAGRPLLEALNDNDPEVKCKAMMALLYLGVKAPEPFAAALKDDAPQVRECAARALDIINGTVSERR